MARSPKEEAARSRRYGRRHGVLRAMKSARELEVVVGRLVANLKRSSVPNEQRKRLLKALKSASDITRRRAAIWAIVDALETDDAR